MKVRFPERIQNRVWLWLISRFYDHEPPLNMITWLITRIWLLKDYDADCTYPGPYLWTRTESFQFPSTHAISHASRPRLLLGLMIVVYMLWVGTDNVKTINWLIRIIALHHHWQRKSRALFVFSWYSSDSCRIKSAFTMAKQIQLKSRYTFDWLNDVAIVMMPKIYYYMDRLMGGWHFSALWWLLSNYILLSISC